MIKANPHAGNSAIVTYTRRWFDPLNPRVEDVNLNDIAHALSLTNRYGGHVSRPYSVAQHSVLCSMVAPEHLKLEALLHDAAEAYLGDMPKPVKDMLPDFKAAEARLEAVIRQKFGLPGERHPDGIVEIDRRMLVTEAKHFGIEWWSWWDYEPYDIALPSWTWMQSKLMFLDTYAALVR